MYLLIHQDMRLFSVEIGRDLILLFLFLRLFQCTLLLLLFMLLLLLFMLLLVLLLKLIHSSLKLLSYHQSHPSRNLHSSLKPYYDQSHPSRNLHSSLKSYYHHRHPSRNLHSSLKSYNHHHQTLRNLHSSLNLIIIHQPSRYQPSLDSMETYHQPSLETMKTYHHHHPLNLHSNLHSSHHLHISIIHALIWVMKDQKYQYHKIHMILMIHQYFTLVDKNYMVLTNMILAHSM